MRSRVQFAQLPAQTSLLILVSLSLIGAPAQDHNGGRVRIADKVAAAKAAGKQTLELLESSGQEASIGSLAEALTDFTVVVGTPVDKQTLVEPLADSIATWYKFAVLEELTRGGGPDPLAPSLNKLPDSQQPSHLLPVGEKEVLVFKPGGTLTLNGVRIVATEPGFPDPAVGHVYLLFISESSDRLAIFEMGAASVFEVVGDQLAPVGPKGRAVVADVNSLDHNSLAALKASIARLKR